MDNFDSSAPVRIAAVLGPFLTILGIWLLVYSSYLIDIFMGKDRGAHRKGKAAKAKFEDRGIADRPGVFYTWATATLLAGLILLNMYSEITADSFVFVSLFGWFMLVLGLSAFFLPRLVATVLFSSSNFLHAVGIIPLVWGLVLTAIGYFY